MWCTTCQQHVTNACMSLGWRAQWHPLPQKGNWEKHNINVFRGRGNSGNIGAPLDSHLCVNVLGQLYQLIALLFLYTRFTCHTCHLLWIKDCFFDFWCLLCHLLENLNNLVLCKWNIFENCQFHFQLSIQSSSLDRAYFNWQAILHVIVVHVHHSPWGCQFYLRHMTLPTNEVISNRIEQVVFSRSVTTDLTYSLY